MVGDLLQAADRLSVVRATELLTALCRPGQRLELGLDRGAGIEWLEAWVSQERAATDEALRVRGLGRDVGGALGSEKPEILVFFRVESEGYAFASRVLGVAGQASVGGDRATDVELRKSRAIHRFSRRSHIRVPLEGVQAMLSWVAAEGGDKPVTVGGHVQDISVGGAAVVLTAVDDWREEEFRRAPLLTVEFEIPPGQPLALRAGIAWLRMEPQPRRQMCLGLTWRDAPAAAAEAIGAFVREKRKDSMRGGLEAVRSRGR